MKKVAAEKQNLTDRTLKAFKKKPAAPGERRTVWDGLLPGFGVRITDKGRVSFFVFRRRAGGGDRPVRVTIGPYPAMSLERARTIARGAVEDLAAGVDPREKRVAEERAETQRREDTFSAVAEEFIKRHASKLRSKKQIEGVVRGRLIPEWGKRPITDITKRDVVTFLEKLSDKYGMYSAHHANAIGRTLFNWAIDRETYGLGSSPFERIRARKLIGAKKHRERVLNDDELRLVWRAAERLDKPFGPFVQMLILTGQRLRDVSDMSWAEVNLREKLWIIPRGRYKSDTMQEVPLSPTAVALLENLPRFDKNPFVFTTNTRTKRRPSGATPISGFSKLKARLDRRVAALRTAEEEVATRPRRRRDDLERRIESRAEELFLEGKGEGMPHWVLHDLRRTLRTGLAKLRIANQVAELVIGHGKKGLQKVYDQHTYRLEKRLALEQWATHLKTIIGRLCT